MYPPVLLNACNACYCLNFAYPSAGSPPSPCSSPSVLGAVQLYSFLNLIWICYFIVDPTIHVDFNITQSFVHRKGLLTQLIIDATCTVIAADGRPELQFSYNGTTGGEIYFQGEKKLHMKQTNQGFDVVLRTAMFVPDNGEIICSVTDLRGSYEKSKFIYFDGGAACEYSLFCNSR